MSILNGNANTTLWTDITSLWHNATTGELTPAQKTEIAVGSTQEYTPCRQNPNSQECQNLLAQQTQLVNIVAPSTDCKLRLTSNYCLQSWGAVAFAVVGSIFTMFLLYGVITSFILRGKR